MKKSKDHESQSGGRQQANETSSSGSSPQFPNLFTNSPQSPDFTTHTRPTTHYTRHKDVRSFTRDLHTFMTILARFVPYLSVWWELCCLQSGGQQTNPTTPGEGEDGGGRSCSSRPGQAIRRNKKGFIWKPNSRWVQLVALANLPVKSGPINHTLTQRAPML